MKSVGIETIFFSRFASYTHLACSMYLIERLPKIPAVLYRNGISYYKNFNSMWLKYEL